MALGSGSGRRARVVSSLVLVTALAGCAPSGPPDITHRDVPSPQRTTPAELCATLVSYWVREALAGSTWAGLDWEQKGLSNEQLGLHDEILAAARAERERHGNPAAQRLITRETTARCTATDGALGSSENWLPPK
ncbi:hypothetical protein OG875_24270 [Streptomyces sp. NBC_01498]|uniref:hypothetical protein n=1 Tax=Streptomyces sp. NBC_01498 TaxID=2975870 RepID=UPI002E7B3B46|nr:hypothetical protein [Streptomyces sp. NBC_01498]WTL27406.1 hypothetical protein OG875_24270 [Streptomyces sp. NBC_01498]